MDPPATESGPSLNHRGCVKTRLSMKVAQQSGRRAIDPIRRLQSAASQRSNSVHCRYGTAFSHSLHRKRSLFRTAGINGAAPAEHRKARGRSRAAIAPAEQPGSAASVPRKLRLRQHLLSTPVKRYAYAKGRILAKRAERTYRRPLGRSSTPKICTPDHKPWCPGARARGRGAEGRGTGRGQVIGERGRGACTLS